MPFRYNFFIERLNAAMVVLWPLTNKIVISDGPLSGSLMAIECPAPRTLSLEFSWKALPQ